jgi:zinc transporter ZupT
MGSAAAVGVPIAQFLLVTLAIHNISEGAVLGSRLRRTGGRALTVAGVAAIARSSQPLCAVSVLLLTGTVPWLLPWCIGASFGALLYLIVAELLPQSYREVGRTGIAVVVSLAAGMVALMGVAP